VFELFCIDPAGIKRDATGLQVERDLRPVPVRVRPSATFECRLRKAGRLKSILEKTDMPAEAERAPCIDPHRQLRCPPLPARERVG
jgi:hypothetical protein